MTDRQDPEEKAHEELSQHNHSQSRSASIQITRRTDLSTLYKIVRTLIRPLRPRLVKLGKDIPAGSQRLSAPKRRGCEVIENQREGVWEYTFRHVEASQIQSQTRSRSQSQFDNDKPIRMSRMERKRRVSDGFEVYGSGGWRLSITHLVALCF
jgi:hypothetical protein